MSSVKRPFTQESETSEYELVSNKKQATATTHAVLEHPFSGDASTSTSSFAERTVECQSSLECAFQSGDSPSRCTVTTITNPATGGVLAETPYVDGGSLGISKVCFGRVSQHRVFMKWNYL